MKKKLKVFFLIGEKYPNTVGNNKKKTVDIRFKSRARRTRYKRLKDLVLPFLSLLLMLLTGRSRFCFEVLFIVKDLAKR